MNLFDLPLENIAQIISYLTLPPDINSLSLVSSVGYTYTGDFIETIYRDPEYDIKRPNPHFGKLETERFIYVKASYLRRFCRLRTVKLPILCVNQEDLQSLSVHLNDVNFCLNPDVSDITRAYQISAHPYFQYLAEKYSKIIQPGLSFEKTEWIKQSVFENIPEVQEIYKHLNNPVCGSIPPYIEEIMNYYDEEKQKFKIQTDKIWTQRFLLWILDYIKEHSNVKINFLSNAYTNSFTVPNINIQWKHNWLSISGKCNPQILLDSLPLRKLTLNSGELDLFSTDWFSAIQWIDKPYLEVGAQAFGSLTTLIISTWNRLTRFKINIKRGIRDDILNINTVVNRLLSEGKTYPNLIEAKIPIQINIVESFLRIFQSTQTITIAYTLSDGYDESKIQDYFRSYPNLESVYLYGHPLSFDVDNWVEWLSYANRKPWKKSIIHRT